jgi:hypothetical protein
MEFCQLHTSCLEQICCSLKIEVKFLAAKLVSCRYKIYLMTEIDSVPETSCI